MNEQARTAPSAFPTVHTVPTHLMVADTVLTMGYLQLSSRQFLLLLVGGSSVVSLWTRTAGLVALLPPVGTILHWVVLIVASLLILVLAFGRAAGRSFDIWLLVILAYFARPRLYLWRGLREGVPASLSLSAPLEREEEAA